MARNRTRIGTGGLDRLKFEVASELVPQLRQGPAAHAPSISWAAPPATPAAAPVAPQGVAAGDFEQLKFELAQELGVPYQPGYNGDLPAREAGRLGGKIGGNMVRRMIALAEQALASTPSRLT
ncbi:MAG TPA: alpha/beta-type small acid-soluble spore protein [Bacillota bacterium]